MTEEKKEEQQISEDQEIKTNWFESIDRFDQLEIKEELLRGIFGYGFEKPSSIQQKGILPMIKSMDTIAQAQSGTGKTATFSIGVLQQIDTTSLTCQALILAPTRELAYQNTRVIQCLGEHLQVKAHTCTGGTEVNQDKKILKEGVHVVVGTPGRVNDMIVRKHLRTDNMKIFVLDEADEMLGRGFKDQIREIFKLLPPEIQVALFSATLPPDILDMTKQFMRDPATILVKKEDLTLDGIKQFFIAIDKEEWKNDTLIELFKNIDIQQCMIYCKSKERVDALRDTLVGKNFTVSSMHGKNTADERQNVMKEFRTGSSRVLISTDLLCRGIDIQQVSLVINFDMPLQKESYIHRIGRSGRFGRKGVAINFVTPQDVRFLEEIQKHYNTQINEMPFDVTNIYD